MPSAQACAPASRTAARCRPETYIKGTSTRARRRARNIDSHTDELLRHPDAGLDRDGRPRTLASTGNPIFNAPWLTSAQPCVTLPLLEADGLPIGVQLIGGRRDDGRLLRTARWLGAASRPVSLRQQPTLE